MINSYATFIKCDKIELTWSYFLYYASSLLLIGRTFFSASNVT